jgi:hypothetical protein
LEKPEARAKEMTVFVVRMLPESYEKKRVRNELRELFCKGTREVRKKTITRVIVGYMHIPSGGDMKELGRFQPEPGVCNEKDYASESDSSIDATFAFKKGNDGRLTLINP